MDRVRFQNMYAIRAYQGGTISASGVGADAAGGYNSATADADAFALDDSIGVDVNKYGLQLTNQPDFDSGQQIIDQRKATGLSYVRGDVGFEKLQSTRTPVVNLEMDATPKTLALFHQLLMHGGGSESATTPFLKTFIPYDESSQEPTAYAALMKKFSDVDAVSHMVGGAICRSLTVSGGAGEVVKLSAEMLCYNMVSDFDFDPSTNFIEYDDDAPLMFQNLNAQIYDESLQTFYLDNFSYTITNNAVEKHYNNPHPVKFVLGDFSGSGSFTIPYSETYGGGNDQLNNFINGTDVRMNLYWGNSSPSAANDTKIELNMRYNSAPVEGDDEVITTPSFDLVGGDGVYPYSLYVADQVDRGI